MLLPHQRRRFQTDLKILAAYLAGTTAGALITALALFGLSGFAAPLSATARTLLLCAGAAFVWLVKVGPLGGVCSLPEARRQIPSEVFGGGLARGALRFGFELGTGVRTYASSPAPYVLVLWMLLGHPSLGAALLAAVGFGAGRALPLLLRASAAQREQITLTFLSRAAASRLELGTLVAVAAALVLL